MKLGDARVLVTGATGGIGKELADQLHDQGASLLLHGNRRVLALRGKHDRFVSADLFTDEGRQVLVRAAQEFDINVLVNNAGINQFSAFEEADITRIMSTNVISPMELTRQLLPHLKAQPAASIVNIGSTFGQIGFAGYVSYCASKHAIKGFSEALRRELADSRVNVQLISPRATRTGMTDDAIVAMNQEMGTPMDDPSVLAARIVRAIETGGRGFQMGVMQRFQVALNALLPGVVDGALRGQLHTIKKYYLTKESNT